MFRITAADGSQHEYRSVDEISARIAEIDAQFDGQRFPKAYRDEWNSLNESRSEMQARTDVVRSLAGNGNALEGSWAPRVHKVGGGKGDEARSAALRVVERCVKDGDLSPEAADRVDAVISGPDAGLGVDAAYIRAVGDPDYETAFAKMVTRPTDAVLRMSPKEQAAVQAVTSAEEGRAMVEGTTTAGGFGIPIAIDPTITLSSSGVANPIRELATVRTMATRELRLVTSDGVVAQYQAEAAEAIDNSPTLAQPVLKASRATSFVPFSFELGDDWPSLRAEISKLIADAKDVLEATKFWTGSGTDEPQGVITGATTVVTTAGTAAFALADFWTLKAAIPPRFIGQTTFVAAPQTFDTVYRFIGGNSTEPLQFDNGRGGTFLGRPKAELSTVVTASTTGSKIMVAGDFKSGYVIGDRLGMSLEIIPHLFGATNRFPTGQRGAYAYWRNDGRVAVPNALRVLITK
jgi:HK97 family phage major capsid protein